MLLISSGSLGLLERSRFLPFTHLELRGAFGDMLTDNVGV